MEGSSDGKYLFGEVLDDLLILLGVGSFKGSFGKLLMELLVLLVATSKFLLEGLELLLQLVILCGWNGDCHFLLFNASSWLVHIY